MEGQEGGLAPSYLYASEHLNSRLAPDESNRVVALKALAHIEMAFNSPNPVGEVADWPENALGESAYRVGLEAFARGEGPK